MEVDILQPDSGEPPQTVKLWARRVWTLELSLVGTLVVLPQNAKADLLYLSRFSCSFIMRWHISHDITI